MTIYDLTTSDRDIPGTRYFDLDNGNKVVFSRDTNPFGYWTVRFHKGGLPTQLDGMYTSYDQAFAAFQKYLSEKNEKRYTEVKVKEESTKKKQKSELFAKD